MIPRGFNSLGFFLQFPTKGRYLRRRLFAAVQEGTGPALKELKEGKKNKNIRILRYLRLYFLQYRR
jgi:hypothetical protein